MRDFWTVAAKRDFQQGKKLADVAKKGGAHFVSSSVGGAERNTGITHWETKWLVEKNNFCGMERIVNVSTHPSRN